MAFTDEKVAAPPPTREPLRHDPDRDISEYIEDEEQDRLRIGRDNYPDGFDLQWVTHSVFGRVEAQHRGRFERKGWVPVLTTDFDGRYRHFMPEQHTGEIEVDGLVLMARPKRFSERAKALEDRAANEKVQIKERQLMGGELEGVKFDTQHASALAVNRIGKSYETIAVPDNKR